MTDKIRAALETKLSAMGSALPTAFENMAFTPVQGTAWQQANILWANPDNRTLGAERRFERGIFQITLHYPKGNGAGVADTQAELVRMHFKRGTVCSASGQDVQVMNTPAKRNLGVIIDGFFSIAISINFQAEVIS